MNRNQIACNKSVKQQKNSKYFPPILTNHAVFNLWKQAINVYTKVCDKSVAKVRSVFNLSIKMDIKSCLMR